MEDNIKGFYLVTNYHNPTGINTSKLQRNAIYNLAIKYSVYILSDDIYELFYINEESRTVPIFYCNDYIVENNIKAMDDFDNNQSQYIISINSLNKLSCPGLRIVYIL